MQTVISFFCLSILLISCKRDEAAIVPKEIVYAEGMTTNYLTVNNVKRKYLVYRPIGITEIKAVVMVLHGGGGLGIGVSDIGAHPLSVFRTIADNEKFLVVYPEGSFDMTKVGAAGHSFGGYATIALSGSKMYEGNTIVTYTDSRIKSFVVLSPSGKDQYGLYINATDNSWNQINKPVYCILGEYEIETDGGGNYQEPGWRLQAYNYMPAGDKYQSVLPKVLHHHFNDRGTPALGEEAIEESTQRFVKQNALHFFNYYLSNNGDINLLGTLGNVTGVTNSKK